MFTEVNCADFETKTLKLNFDLILSQGIPFYPLQQCFKIQSYFKMPLHRIIITFSVFNK